MGSFYPCHKCFVGTQRRCCESLHVIPKQRNIFLTPSLSKSGRVLVEPSLTEEYFTVEARFFLSDESLADSISVHFEPKGNSYALAIDTPEKLQAGECIKAELTVRVPKQEGTPIALFIRSQNAAIVLNNLTDHAIFSSVHLAARNGAVKVHGLHPVNGALDVSVENGAVTLHETATQSVAVKLQNGPLKLSDASVRDSAAFEVRNGGITGYLTATGAQNQTTIQAGTYNAAVDLHVDGTPKSVSATSHNGAARVHLPLHFWGTFDAATKRGRAQVSGGNDLHFGPPDKNAPWGSSHKAGWKGEEGGPQGVRVQTINGIASIVFTD
ncbi:hypothetical protein HKX48_008121 [Thoreauomyces humboldtii]|nr:hypothetical protein HKX48_008121 [Thoreauomyces humboldtii]